MAKTPTLGDALLEGLEEASAWKRGEVALETVNIDPTSPAGFEIRKSVAEIDVADVDPMALETTKFDAAKYLDTAESQAELIADAFESGSAQYITHALGVVARARGGFTRAGDEALRKVLSENDDLKLSTLVGALKVLGLNLTVQVEARQRRD